MIVLPFYGAPGRMTRRLAGTVISAQGLVVFFGALVARALAAADGSNTSGTPLLVGSLLAVLCILDAALLRRPWGITLGWVLQIATLATALAVPTMLVVGLLFGALWLTALAQGRAMDEHTRRVDAVSVAGDGSSRADVGSAQEPLAQSSSNPEPPAPDASRSEPSPDEPSTRDG